MHNFRIYSIFKPMDVSADNSPSPEINKIELPSPAAARKPKILKIILIIFGLLIVFSIILAVVIGIPAYKTYGKAKKLYQTALEAKPVLQTKDMKLISEKINLIKIDLSDLKESFKPLLWLKIIPYFGEYVGDAQHFILAGEAGLDSGDIVIKAIEPYSDIIGFNGGANTGSGEKTTQDRITFLVTTIDKIGPDLDKISEKFQIVKKEIDQVNTNRYPVSFKGQKVREPLVEIIAMIDQAATVVSDAKPLLSVTPWLLGSDAPRRYLLLFQNDAELRPTGGFLTAYAILEVNKGKIKPQLSQDIYALDARFTKRIPAPEPIKKYLPKVNYFNLRDMNLSPDFSSSMQTFLENYVYVDKKKFDGVIAVDTKVLVSLLEVLGPVGVSEWGNFSAKPDSRCDGCPQVVYALELLADKPVSTLKADRKAVIGPLMNSILANAMGSPKEKIPGLFNAGFKSLMEKHVLFYFPEESIQKAVENFNIAGRIRDYEGDYFHLNDTSFSGAKSNLFIKENVNQVVEINKDGKVTKTVTIEYTNPTPASNCNLEAGQLCLNAPYRDWFRIYVPKGSKLLESSGSEVEMTTSEDLGKTVFEGFFGDKYPLRPEGSAKVTLKYELPMNMNKEYKLLIQKQPGTDGFTYNIKVNNQKQNFVLDTDKELKFKL